MPHTDNNTPEIGERVPNCRGSFKVGTACGLCARCKSRGYSVEKKEKAIEAEKERTKDFPANRVKPREQKVDIEVVMPTVEGKPVEEKQV